MMSHRRRIGPARVMTMAVIATVGLFLFAFSVFAAPAKTKKDTTRPDTSSETYGSWLLRCGANGKNCYLVQSLVRKKDRRRLARVTIFAPPRKNGKLKLRMLLPLGVALAKGTKLTVDKAAPRKMPYLTCLRSGCMAELTVPSILERRLHVGNTLTVTVFSLKGAKPIRFQFSLKGLTRAILKLRSK